MQNTLTNLVEILLRKNNISFDKNELNFQIQSHPSYPSLHAITGVLDHFNIENVAADVPKNTETLAQLPNCFLAQINTEKGNDLVVIEKNKSDYIIHNSEKKKEKKSENDFLKTFTGIIVAVEKTEHTIEPESKSSLVLYIAIAALLIPGGYILSKFITNIPSIIHLVLSITGLFTSIAIIKQELGLKTSIGNAFCSGTDDKKDCDAVLTSKGAEVFKGYKLSDLSVLYFVGLTLLTLFQVSSPKLAFTVSLIALPITLYSIYYQYAIVKKWCLLCLSIVGILWAQAVIPVITNTYINSFTIENGILLSIVASITWLTWYYVKPLVSEVTQLRKDKVESVKFKRNFTLFNSLLEKSPQLYTQIDNSQEIIFGNKNSNLEITIITNPFCGHCKPVHKHIDEILNRYNENVKIKIRFNVNTDKQNDDLFKITSRLLQIYNEQSEKACLNAMDAIYDGEKPENWILKFGECTNVTPYSSELDKQRNWCNKNAINFTPEILVNGRSFPKEYNRTDLILFIEELEENTQLNTVQI